MQYFKSVLLKRILAMRQQQLTTSSAQKLLDLNHNQTLLTARACLLQGEVIALPTDTVYGLACDANNVQAIKRLYAIKGRDDNKPVAICVHNVAALRRYGHAEHLSDTLLQQLLPGPITIIIERTAELSNPLLNPNTTRIGIRIPNFRFIRDLCALYKEQPLALTSANLSGVPSSLNVNEFSKLWPQLGLVCDAGQLGLSEDQRLGSTVIDLSMAGYYRIVRKGVGFKSTLQILHTFHLKHMDEKNC